MHEGVWFRKNNFWQNDSCGNLDNFPLTRLLCMHRWCLHGPINFYHSFQWSSLILCQFNIDTLNISMKEFGSEKIIFDKMTAVRKLENFSLIRLLYLHRLCLHGPINSYHSFWWSNLILCPLNKDTMNISMKELGSEKNNFWRNDSCENLDNFSLIWLLYMHE